MAEENPILNNAYEAPQWHYATNQGGELDYSRPVAGRRRFTAEVMTIPLPQEPQGTLLEINGIASAEDAAHLVNLLRQEIERKPPVS